MVTSSTLTSGASIAAGTSLVAPPTITRADLAPIRPNRRPIEAPRGTENFRFPSDIGNYYLKMNIVTYDRTFTAIASGGFGTTAGTILDSVANIILPLPENLTDVNRVNYAQDQMIDTSAIAGAISGGAIGAASTAIKGLAGKAVAGIAGQLLSGAAASAAKIALADTGLAPNQFLTVILKGPEYKKYSFTWKFYPKNAKESGEIQRIIYTIRNAMRTNLGPANAFFNFPKVFNLSFSNSTYLYQFKPAVIDTMSVNYTPSGSPTLYSKTGAPDGVQLTISFSEIEYHLSDERARNSWDTGLDENGIGVNGQYGTSQDQNGINNSGNGVLSDPSGSGNEWLTNPL